MGFDRDPVVGFGMAAIALAYSARLGAARQSQERAAVLAGLRDFGADDDVRLMLVNYLHAATVDPRRAGEGLLSVVTAWLDARPASAAVVSGGLVPAPDWTRRADCGHD